MTVCTVYCLWNQSTWKKVCPTPIPPSQIPLRLSWDRIRFPIVRKRRINASEQEIQEGRRKERKYIIYVWPSVSVEWAAPFDRNWDAPCSNRGHKKEVKEGKGFLLQAWSGSWGSRRLRLLDRLDFRHYAGGKVVTLTHRPPSPSWVFLVLIFRGWVDPRAHSSISSFWKIPQRHHRRSIPRHSD
jgi:hypothetical protein